MNKAEARRFVQCSLWKFLDSDRSWVFQELIMKGKGAKDNAEIRRAIEAEYEFYKRRALHNKEGVYGRYRDFVERVYETRIDCKPALGGAQLHQVTA